MENNSFSLVDIFWQFGNGDMGRGRAVILAIAQRLSEARRKHPVFAQNSQDGCSVIRQEMWELDDAICDKEGEDRERDEALDVAVTAIRFVIGEHKTHD